MKNYKLLVFIDVPYIFRLLKLSMRLSKGPRKQLGDENANNLTLKLTGPLLSVIQTYLAKT